MPMPRQAATIQEQEDRDDLAHAAKGTRKLPRGTPLIDRVRDVTKNGAARVDGLYLDHVTANAVITVHDALNEQNRASFAKMPLRKMVAVTWKLLKK